MVHTPYISVVIPCYNVARYLDQALASAQQNTCPLEIIAVNDGSTDATLDILRAYARRDGRIRVIDKPNEGYGATMNRGISEAAGTYVAIIEPDDWVLPHTYDRLYEMACTQGMPDVVKASYWRVIGSGTPGQYLAHGYLHGRLGQHDGPFVLADEPELLTYHPSIWSALYRRNFLVENDIRFVEAPGAGWVDNPFAVRTLAMAQSIVYTDDAYYCYREDLADASSATIDPLVMICRWHEREDVLDELGIEDASIRRANAVVALRYLSRIMAMGALLNHEVLEAAQSMARRLDLNLVESVHEVKPDVIRCCRALAGQVTTEVPELPYKMHLAKECAWALRNNGPRFLLHNILLSRTR